MPLVTYKIFDQGSTQQFESEQHIFDTQLSVHLPLVSAHEHVSHKSHLQEDIRQELDSMSKVPLNIGGLDDILFVSTLTRVQSSTNKPMTSSEMKRQSSQQYMSSGPIYYTSQPETHHYYSSSSSSSSSSSERKMSIQSDVVASAELIRRFSSGSTTSTVATSISSTASLPPLVDAQTTGDKMKLTNQLVIQPDEQELSDIPNQHQQLGHDPGHACDTMHSPYTLQHNNKSKEAIDERHQGCAAPVWADPLKVKENPTRYEEAKSFLRKNKIPLTSALPLVKPCVFYFSDTNIKQQCYISAVNSVFQCDTVWQFSSRWRQYKQTCSKKPSQLLPNQNLFCFIYGVEPMWEDKVNEKGGRLTITIQNNGKHLDDVFEWILCSFIGGGIFEHGVVGIVVSKRNRGDRIELWLDESNTTTQTISEFKEHLCAILPGTCHNEINASRYKKHF